MKVTQIATVQQQQDVKVRCAGRGGQVSTEEGGDGVRTTGGPSRTELQPVTSKPQINLISLNIYILCRLFDCMLYFFMGFRVTFL